MMASSGFSTGQWATTVCPEIWLHSCVPRDCFLTSNDFVRPLSELEWWNVYFLCNPLSRRNIKKMNWIYPEISPQIRRDTSSKRHRRRQSISSAACACRLSLAAARLSSTRGSLSLRFPKRVIYQCSIGFSLSSLPWFLGGFCKPVCRGRSHQFRSCSRGNPISDQPWTNRFPPIHWSVGW